MGAIQSGINQLLTTAGFMAGLSPELKKFREIQDIKGKSKVLQEQTDIAAKKEMQSREELENISARVENAPEGPLKRIYEMSEQSAADEVQRNLEAQVPISEAQTETARQLFELKPTKETFEDYMSQKSLTEYVQGAPSYFREQRKEQLINREEVMRKMQDKGMNKVKQNQVFNDLIETLKKEGY